MRTPATAPTTTRRVTTRVTARVTTRVLAAAVGPALGLVAGPGVAVAQDRLIGLRAAGTGVNEEYVSFGTGLWQTPLPGQDSVRVRSASQLTVPFTTAIPVGRSITVDATAVYASGGVRYDRVDASGVMRSATAALAGVSDVRVRLTGRLFDERIVVTAGANAPTGRTSLDSAQIVATRVLAAPAIGFGVPPIGAGPSGTLGVLAVQSLGTWALAAGVSYEHRGTFAPVAALVAGLTSLDYAPGDVVRLSLSGDGILARGRLSATVSTDFYQPDRLRGGAVIGTTTTAPNGTAPAATATVATVQLGPIVAVDLQYRAPVPAVREFVLYGGAEYRAPYARDDVRLGNTHTTYLNGGFRTVVPFAPARDGFVGGDLRYSSGIGTGGGLTTAFYTAGAVTAGLSQRVRRLTLQPYVRAQVGRVIGRGPDVQHDGAFRGAAGGVTLLTRF